MDEYFLSLARACLEYGGIDKAYYDNVPQDIVVPSIYFAPAEHYPSTSTLNEFSNVRTVYFTLFAYSRREAGRLAGEIVQRIMLNHCRIPLYDGNDKPTGESFKVESPSSRITDDGMAEITMSYRTHERYDEKRGNGASVAINIGHKK